MIPIQQFESKGIKPEYLPVSESTRTASEAAAALGTTLDHIVKSLVFIVGLEPVLIMVPGHKQADLTWLSNFFGVEVRLANADEVKSLTGFSIGVVPPYGHKTELKTYIAKCLLELPVVFFATGSRKFLAKANPLALLSVCCAEPI